MTTRQIQYLIALVFLILGGWACFFPQHVITTVFLPAYHDGGRALPFAIACFGAQALISGLFAAFSRFTATTFLAYGLALLPFFGFNYYFTFYDPIFNNIGLIDAVGNIIMLGLCYIGWKQARQTEIRG